MELNGIASDLVNLSILINCFSQMGLNSLSFSVFANILKKSYHPDPITLNTLIKGLCLKGVKPDVVTYNSLMDGYCLVKEMNKAKGIFNTIAAQSGVTPDVLSYNIMINGFCKVKMVDEALNLLKEMRCRNIIPDVVKDLSKSSGIILIIAIFIYVFAFGRSWGTFGIVH
ncbi:pentatricopeptide (PPR) repeat protein [Trifolium pratense]|uniref:Pentatricopeptide (PPR) repeat protein n=1 Tax=Trifolium pratense TaxID=57577 RepID=A0A2K3MIT2_TRIPR|nr:pentatricopeptide (PPR) repeat protein [Trifolium pratense]